MTLKSEPKEFTRSDLQNARYAIVLDLEGSIGMMRVHSRNPNAKRYCVTLRVWMKNPEILERMNAYFGVGTLKHYARPGRPYWIWFCGKREAVTRILNQLKPYLVLKSNEASIALEYLETDLTPEQQDRIYLAMRRPKVRQPHANRKRIGAA